MVPVSLRHATQSICKTIIKLDAARDTNVTSGCLSCFVNSMDDGNTRIVELKQVNIKTVSTSQHQNERNEFFP